MATPTKSLLLGSILYVYFIFGDAASSGQSQVASVVSETVERSLPSHVYASVYGHGALRRYKREVTSKHFDDPEDCIRQCHDNETSMIVKATMKNMAKLMTDALSDVTGDDLRDPVREAAFKKRVEEKTIANMGPMFSDLCTASKAADDCLKACPSSQLRQISILEHAGSEVLCEPSKNWNSFSEYFHALNCTNTTADESHCDKKCGTLVPLSNVTSLEIKEADETGDNINFENDSAKNTAAVGAACKKLICSLDCYKPLMTDQCGAKAYELYARTSKLEPHSTLGILKLLHAVDKTNECKNFQ